jgi:hypothetical protein
MNTYALVQDGTVVNITLWDGSAEVDFGDGITAVAVDPSVQIGFTYDGTTFTAPASTVPIPSAQSMADEIDNLVATIYSNWTRFQQEYLLRQQAAQAFKDDGYAGDPGVWVTAYATSANVTNQQAADTILSQAALLDGALQQLGALRMQKYCVLNAADPATAQTTYNQIVANIQAIAKTLN